LKRQVTDHLARATLARYFSPNVVDVLASSGPTGMAARRQPVAVLFADIRGFTTLSEFLGTEGTLRLLQEFHELVSSVVFQHHGTLEKYIGDAVMATFGTPAPGPDDASCALRCARELALETSRWSVERASRGDPPVEIGMGLHYGEAMVGSIGSGQRLDYVVIGDTVNVASRLERLTRDLDAEIVVSDDLVERAQDEDSAAGAPLDLFSPRGDVHVTGRQRPIRIWSADRRAVHVPA
jgi:adenylate cyclase